MESMKAIIRHSAPTQYDHAQKGTVCIVKPEQGGEQYIQRSDDPEKPKWEKI